MGSMGWNEGAANAFRRAVALNRRYAEAWAALGYTLGAQAKYNEATVAYRRALLLKPDDAESWQYLGDALLVQAKLKESVEAYHQAIKRKSDNPHVWQGLAVAYTRLGLASEAQSAFTVMEKLAPNLAEEMLAEREP